CGGTRACCAFITAFSRASSVARAISHSSRDTIGCCIGALPCFLRHCSCVPVREGSSVPPSELKLQLGPSTLTPQNAATIFEVPCGTATSIGVPGGKGNSCHLYLMPATTADDALRSSCPSSIRCSHPPSAAI